MARRRGRKRKVETPRQPNGQPARPAEDQRLVVLEQRRRFFGLTKEQAKLPMAGTAPGREFMRGKITREEESACRIYLSLYEKYQRALGGPMPVRAIPYEKQPKGSGDNDNVSPEETRKAVDKWLEVTHLLNIAHPDAQNQMHDLAVCDVDPEPGRNRNVLNRAFFALTRHWGLTSQVESA